MQRSKLLGSIAGAALAAVMAGSIPAAATTNQAPSLSTGTLSGAFLSARTAERSNDFDSAVAFYREALRFDPRNTELRQSLMLVLLTDGQFKDALPIAEDLKTVPEIERFSRLALAVDALAKKRYRSADSYLKLALQSELDRMITGLLSAFAKAGAGKPNEALAAIDKLEGPEGFTLFKTYSSALIAQMAGQKDKAAAFYQSAIDDRTNVAAAPDTYERIVESFALFKLRSGDREGAQELVSKATEMLSGRMVLTEFGKKIANAKSVEPLVATPQQGAAEVLYTVATAINRDGGEAFSKLYLQMSLPLRPNHDATLYQLGDISSKMDQSERAIEFFDKVPKDSPYRRDAEMQQAINLAALKRNDEAIGHLNTLLANDPQDMRTYLAIGSIYAGDKNFAKAAEIYDKAVLAIKEPVMNDWTIFYQRGIAYERLKQWDKAEPDFKKALELFPDQPQVLNYLGYSWIDRNINLNEGLDLIKRAVASRPQDGYIVDSLGWAYYRLGRYDEAVVELEKAVKLRAEDWTINDHLGDAYWKVGRKLEATFQWAHARDGKPEPEDLARIEEKLKNGLPEEKAPGVAQNGTEKAN
ncbi:tetratricopeptide repeat protein [Phyllobacterium sp. 0TCS1.6C]|uniref:tetratricopeptide repeat protein n=1 Tax=unclassified Phyllobacterium TaxID=2638441 RepID=UPI002264B1FF|nr:MULTISPECIES: tetratricopeptide repeat protein [unclassified Phyllobacterium]MCX8281430.1 tetratricopeptide repeat protein [Phyllobacterium sp. 0TCS1.6C]MCX8295914.1 tetratricopeptide repeat protein [Phyllobacterium sp. 0TCS1.6A]